MRWMLCLVLVAVFMMGNLPVFAQANILLNGDMEAGFSAEAGMTGVPLHWAFFQVGGSLDADRESHYVVSPSSSWVMRSKYASWTAGGRQTVAVTPGAVYRLTVQAFLWTCNDDQWSCIPNNAPRFSHQESNGRVKIGLDPNGGIDPLSTAIVWSPWAQPWDAFQTLSVEAAAVSGFMSVFLLAESGGAMAFNEVYWDNASLFSTGETAAPTSGGETVAAIAAPQVAAPPPIENTVPFVSAQQARPDGSVVHRVQQGDTFLSILVAYTDFGISKELVLQLNNWRFEPQYINIGDEIIILPPGSVDPTSGALLNLPNVSNTASSPAAADPAPVAEAPPAQAPSAAASLRVLSAAEVQALLPLEPIAPFLP